MTAIHHDDTDETIKPLAEDNDPPFSLPDDVDNQQGQETDTDRDEAYHEGESSATGVQNRPDHDSGIASYDPDQDSSKS